MENSKTPLIGMTLDELRGVAAALGMPSFTAKQMAKWLYDQHVSSIDEMTNLSKVNRQRLAEHYTIGCRKPVDAQHSKDGTVKYLFPTSDGKQVETVFIPEGERATLCVSCEVGCKMNCLFCQTGKQGFEGALSAADILNQIYSVPGREQLTRQPRQRAPRHQGAHGPMGLRLEPEAHHGEQRRHQGKAEAIP